jgi:hypothetical protein
MRSFAVLVAFVTALPQALAHGGQGLYEIDGVQYNGWVIDPAWGHGYNETTQRHAFALAISDEYILINRAAQFNDRGSTSTPLVSDTLIDQRELSLLIGRADAHR